MKMKLTLLAATTALSAVISAPAWSAMRTSNAEVRPFAAVLEVGQDAMPLILASGDDDDREYRNGARSEDDDDREYGSGSRHDEDDDDCDDDGDDDCGTSPRNAAPAGTVAPPQNGLFGNGAAPKVQMN